MAIYDLVIPHGGILDIYGGWRYETATSSPLSSTSTSSTSSTSSTTSSSSSSSSTTTTNNNNNKDLCVREYIDKSLPIPGREPLMLTCRFLRSETVRYFYGHNDFELLAREDTLTRTLDWIWTRPPGVFSVLRRVIVEDMHDCTEDPESPQYCSWMLGVELETLGLEALRDGECSGWVIHCRACWERHCGVVEGIEGHRLWRGVKKDWRYGEMNAERLVELVRKLRYGAKSWR